MALRRAAQRRKNTRFQGRGTPPRGAVSPASLTSSDAHKAPGFASHLASRAGEPVQRQIGECAKAIAADLDRSRVSLVMVFCSEQHATDYGEVVGSIQSEFPSNPKVAGISSSGVIGAYQESENEQTISLLATTLPPEHVSVFTLDSNSMPDLDASQSEWLKAIGSLSAGSDSNDTIVTFADSAFQRNLQDALNGMKFALPNANIVGGLVGGGFERRALFYHDGISRGGYYRNTAALVGVLLEGVDTETVVAQGASPVVEGEPREFEVIEHKQSLIESMRDTLTGKTMTPLEALKLELERVDDERRQEVAQALLVSVTPSLAASESLTASAVAAAAGYSSSSMTPRLPPEEDEEDDSGDISSENEASEEQASALNSESRTGQQGESSSGQSAAGAPAVSNETAWLVRPIAGMNPNEGAMALGERVFPGMRLRFMARDRKSAVRDVRERFSELKRADLERALEGTSSSSRGLVGGLQISCNGRGFNLFQEAGFDVRHFSEARPLPLAGFFAGGEIAPVVHGGQAYLHGFTSVFCSFSVPNSGKVDGEREESEERNTTSVNDRDDSDS